MARVLAGIRMLAAVPSFEVMSWRGAGGIHLPNVPAKGR